MSLPEMPGRPGGNGDGSNAEPEDRVVWADGPEDTTVRPSKTPGKYKELLEELRKLPPGEHPKVIIADGPEDTTHRPRDPNRPFYGPDGKPLPPPAGPVQPG